MENSFLTIRVHERNHLVHQKLMEDLHELHKLPVWHAYRFR